MNSKILSNINARINKKGETKLHLAAKKDQKGIAKILIRAGADVNAKCNKLETPLHKAAKSNNLELVQILLQRGANVNLMSKEGSALHIAIQKGYDDIVGYLIKNNADVNIN